MQCITEYTLLCSKHHNFVLNLQHCASTTIFVTLRNNRQSNTITSMQYLELRSTIFNMTTSETKKHKSTVPRTKKHQKKHHLHHYTISPLGLKPSEKEKCDFLFQTVAFHSFLRQDQPPSGFRDGHLNSTAEGCDRDLLRSFVGDDFSFFFRTEIKNCNWEWVCLFKCKSTNYRNHLGNFPYLLEGQLQLRKMYKKILP